LIARDAGIAIGGLDEVAAGVVLVGFTLAQCIRLLGQTVPQVVDVGFDRMGVGVDDGEQIVLGVVRELGFTGQGVDGLGDTVQGVVAVECAATARVDLFG